MIETGFLSTKDQQYNQRGIVFGGGPAPLPPNQYGANASRGLFGANASGSGLFGAPAHPFGALPLYGAQPAGGPGLFGGAPQLKGQINKVLKIEKIMNNNIFDKFTLELRKTLKKYT